MQKELTSSGQKIFERSTPLNIPLLLAVSFILGASSLFGRCSPFAPAFTAGLAGFDCIISFAGALGGIVLSGQIDHAVPTIAALVIVCTVKLFITGKSGRGWRILSASTSAAAVFVTVLSNASEPSHIAVAAGFAIAAGMLTYSLSELFTAYGENKIDLNKPSYIAFCSIVLACAAAALTGFGWEVFSLGRIAASAAIIAAAQRWGFTGGAVCGVVATFGVTLGNSDFCTGMAMVAFGGIVCGAFAELGRVTQVIAFAFTASVSIVVAGIDANSVGTIADTVIGCLLYLVIPFKERAKSAERVTTAAEYREVMSEKLKFAGDSVSEVRASVIRTAEVLDKVYRRDLSAVYERACDEVCRSCHKSMVCWGTDFDAMTECMNKITVKLRTGENAEEDDFPDFLSERCTRRKELVSKLNLKWREQLEIQSASRRVNEMRKVFCDQLSATEKLLDGFSAVLQSGETADSAAAEKVCGTLRDFGLVSVVSAAVIDKKGRMRIEAYGRGVLSVDREYICELFIAALHREFDLPQIITEKTRTRFLMYERTLYTAEIECFQLNKGRNSVSGDFFDSYIDENGTAYAVLSDGMGSGKRARVDSAFACGLLMSLLRGGIPLNSALETVNSSLLVKSADESFSTLDICMLDLCTGGGTMYKCGAAPTYIKNAARLVKIGCSSLPAGAAGGIRPEEHSFRVDANDLIVMMTDGAQLDEEWLTRILSSNVSTKQLAEQLATGAKLTAEGESADDISVAVIKVLR